MIKKLQMITSIYEIMNVASLGTAPSRNLFSRKERGGQRER